MYIKATKETVTVKVDKLDIPFKLSFSNTKRNDISDAYNHWFTPSGKCKVWFGGLRFNHIGQMSSEQHANLIEMMIDSDSEIVKGIDGKYYTRTSQGLSEILEGKKLMKQITEEWNATKDYTDWKGFEYGVNEWGEIIRE